MILPSIPARLSRLPESIFVLDSPQCSVLCSSPSEIELVAGHPKPLEPSAELSMAVPRRKNSKLAQRCPSHPLNSGTFLGTHSQTRSHHIFCLGQVAASHSRSGCCSLAGRHGMEAAVACCRCVPVSACFACGRISSHWSAAGPGHPILPHTKPDTIVTCLRQVVLVFPSSIRRP